MDVDAEREKITKEIKELERILDPSSSSIHLEVSESSLDSSGSEADSLPNEDSDTTGAPVLEGERWGEASNDEEDHKDKTLPEDPETCLQLNMVYQEVIREKLAEVSQLLAQNREQQEEILWDLAGSKGLKMKEGRSLPPNMYIGHFMKPYFKDKVTGVGPPANEDTREKAAQGIKAFEALLVTKWKHWEKALLRKSVVSDRLQRLLQPKLLKLEYLRQKQSRVSSEPERQALEKQVREAEKEIQDINQLPEEALLGNRLDSHDWEKISNVNFEGGRSAEEIRKFWQSSEHPSINKQDWSTEEAERLRAIAAKHGHLEWQLVAEELGTGRSAFQCLQKFQQHNTALKRKEWTEEEDHMLTQLVQEMRVGDHIPYRRIVYYMEGRDSMQLIYRWTKSLDPSLKKGFWTPEEDAKLLQAVAKYGEQDWFKIREEVPGRSDAQCRDRYLRRLHFSLKKGRWNAKEEEQLIELIEKYGVGHWAKIASELPHRSGSQCLSKWKIMVGRNQSLPRRRRRRPRRRVRWSSSSSSDGGSEDSADASSSSSSSSSSSESSEAELEEPQGQARVLLPPQYTVPDLDLWVPARQSASQPQKGGASSSLPKGSDAAPSRPKEVPTSAPGGELPSRIQGTIPRGVQYPHPPDTHPVNVEEPACEKERQRQPALPDSPPGPGPGDGVTGPHLKRLWRQRQRHTLRQRLLDRKLLLAVTPWVGDVTLPCTQASRRPGAVQTHADSVRMKLEHAHLASTPVFTLFIQLLQIDTAGCMEVVRERKARPLTALQPGAQAPLPRLLQESASVRSTPGRPFPNVPPQGTAQNTSYVGYRGLGSCHTESASSQVPAPAPCGPRPKPKTVSELLREKRLRESRAKKAAQAPVALQPQLLVSSPVVLQPSLPPASQGLPAPCLTITNPTLSGPGSPVLASASPSGSWQEAGASAKDERPAGLQAVTLTPVLPGAQGTASSACSLPALGLSQGPVSCPPSSLGQPQAPATSQEQSLPRVLPLFPRTPSPAQLPVQPLSLPPQGGSPLASLPLPVTWVLTAQGLLPVPVQAMVGMSGQVATPDPAGLPATLPPPPAEPPCLSPASADPEPVPSSTTLPPTHLLSRSSAEDSEPQCAPAEAQAGHTEAEPPRLNQLPTHSAPGCRGDAAGIPGNSSGSLSLERPEKGAWDLGLLSQENEAALRKWLKGQQGAHVPQLESRLPYQPPALCNLRVLSSLLLHKKALEQKAASLLAGAEPEAGATQSSLGLVRRRLRDNPAYLLLKTRFLAAFALPAFLATLPPCGVPTTLSLAPRVDTESEDDLGELDCKDTSSVVQVGPVAMSPTQRSPRPGKASAPSQLDTSDDLHVLRTRHAQHARKRRRLP
ncbi:snRNA-activating protein complex subunit 4 isoform X2 [Dipodomys merriami]|uniref:snRNA-activating protein complex subunit 4 isoform X2 n=1 Tax=Dipodomys merriami TaxID=94247 RepID=UPI0038515020